MKWVIAPYRADAHALSAKLGIPLPLAKVLVNRGVNTEERARLYLYEPLGLLNDPFYFSHMEKAVERILKARSRKKKILIYGDYDADGITASALLYRFLKRLGCDVEVFIPHRIADGYSINLDSLRKSEVPDFSLLITVDCGISSIQEVSALKREGIDVIVTDHHEPAPFLPPADAVINPKADGSYPFRGLAGVGVALKLAEAVILRLEGDKERKAVIKEFLPLVAVGTVADVMEIRDENRFFVKFGLKMLKDFVPFAALTEAAGISDRALKPWDVSFIIAPRLNAPGRISHARKAFELLVEDDGERALELARELNRENSRRQREEEKVFGEALSMCGGDEPVVFVWKDGWHPGVIGVVASKLASHFASPAFIVSFNGGRVGRGSGRSFGGVNLHRLMSRVRGLLVSWGGHEKAVGFNVEKDKVELLKEHLSRAVEEEERVEDVLFIDDKLEFELLDAGFVRDYLKLRPFGEGFEEPLFLFEGLKVRFLKPMSKGISFLAVKDGIGVDAYSFDVEIERLKGGGSFDVVASIEFDMWKERKRLRLKVKDVRKSSG